jgi:hypothetical protein
MWGLGWKAPVICVCKTARLGVCVCVCVCVRACVRVAPSIDSTSVKAVQNFSLSAKIARGQWFLLFFSLRSSSLIDIVSPPFSSSLTASSPVQRSSSLRLPETKTPVGKTWMSKDRCSDRRLSCIPFIVRDFSNAELKITSVADSQQNCAKSPEMMTEGHVAVNSCVLSKGDENVEVVEGRVGKMKRGNVCNSPHALALAHQRKSH